MKLKAEIDDLNRRDDALSQSRKRLEEMNKGISEALDAESGVLTPEQRTERAQTAAAREANAKKARGRRQPSKLPSKESPVELAAALKSGSSDADRKDNVIEWLLTFQSQVAAISEVLIERGLTSQQELDARTARIRREMFPSDSAES